MRIKDEKQYRITEARVRGFEKAIGELDRQQRPPDISPQLWKAQRDAAESQLQDLLKNMQTYDRLRDGRAS